jgi:hypothetical protein
MTTMYKLIYRNYKHVQKYTNIFTNTKVTKYAKFIKALVD